MGVTGDVARYTEFEAAWRARAIIRRPRDYAPVFTGRMAERRNYPHLRATALLRTDRTRADHVALPTRVAVRT
jgi:hypothetical protein